MLFYAPLARPFVLLLLLDLCSSCSSLLFCSSYSTYCSCSSLLLRSSYLICCSFCLTCHSSCSTYYFAPLSQLTSLFLLDLLLRSFCLTCYSSCLTCYFAPFVQPIFLLLLNLLLCSSCSTHSTPLTQPFYSNTSLLCL